MLNVLVIDDEPVILLTLADALRTKGHRVDSAENGLQAIEAVRARGYDLILCDVRMPQADGMAVLREVHQLAPTTPVILMTAYATVPDAVAALKEGATDFLTKPFGLDVLLSRVERVERELALKRDLHRAELSGQSTELPSGLIGSCPSMIRLQERIDRFAASDAPVLIEGESGTGKELVARALHQKSARRNQPFIAVNCAAFPETLLEAELFGHERGAFTGAYKRRDGRFKAADGGTLLLDEVAEIPLAAQAKLLRVLQERSFEPLGTNQALTVDVRILSATHRNLKELVSQGKFREDLYYRLKILELEVPPLRERKADLPALIRRFLSLYSSQQMGLSVRAIAALTEYAFPGNVRELEHAIQHAVALTLDGEEVDLQHLPSDIVGSRALTPGVQNPCRPLGIAMREFERDYLIRALSLGDGSKTKTATLLGISRKNLWEKLKRHDLASSGATGQPD